MIDPSTIVIEWVLRDACVSDPSPVCSGYVKLRKIRVIIQSLFGKFKVSIKGSKWYKSYPLYGSKYTIRFSVY